VSTLSYLGMALLAMRRLPWLATISAALALAGWIPWAALMGIDDLAYDVAQRGSPASLAALWTTFNTDPVMSVFMYIYIIGHLLSAIFLGVVLNRARLIPRWAGWALILSSPVQIVAFAAFKDYPRFDVLLVACALLIVGSFPAALAMLQNKDGELPAPSVPETAKNAASQART
jgi:hypothetical protein